MHFTQRVRRARRSIRRAQTRPELPEKMMLASGPSMSQRPDHAHKRERREDSKEDIVSDDEGLEGLGLAEAVGFVVALAVDLVPEDDGDGVGEADGDGDTVVEGALVQGRVDGEGDGEGARVGAGVWWEGHGLWRRGEFEVEGRRPAELN